MRHGMILLSVLFGGCCMGGAPSAPPAVTVSPGFAPLFTSGMAGGATDATTFAPACVGLVPTAPQHTLSVVGPIPNLRILVNGLGADTTLVVRLPDGTYRCNDDSEGLNPIVEGPVSVGNVDIFVGTLGAPDALYNLYVTEEPFIQPSSIL